MEGSPDEEFDEDTFLPISAVSIIVTWDIGSDVEVVMPSHNPVVWSIGDLMVSILTIFLFCDTLTHLDLVQIVSVATHTKGNVLDLITTIRPEIW